MAASIQVKRGTTAKVAAYTPLSGELVLDTSTNKLYAGDGVTAGGNQIIASKAGVTDGSTAVAGQIGETITNTTTTSSVTSGTTFNMTSVTLTPGDWEVNAVLDFEFGSGVTATVAAGGVNTTSGTVPSYPYLVKSQCSMNGGQHINARRRINLSSSATIYLVGVCTFSGGTTAANGYLEARRVR